MLRLRIAFKQEFGYSHTMAGRDPKLREIWEQAVMPVVFRQGGRKPLLVRLPYGRNNRAWLKHDHRNHPTWNAKNARWELPKAWFEDVTERAMQRYGAVYVIQPFRELQKCARACWDASGLECECSCMGRNHGSGHPDGRWYEIAETCAVSWGERRYSFRLMKPASTVG